MKTEVNGRRFTIRGVVQGVGFRPYVYNLAISLSLTGWVKNSSRGLEIEIQGSPPALQEFEARLRSTPPPLARVDTFQVEPCSYIITSSFKIADSEPHPGEFLPVAPDTAICDDCRRELFDPHDRRFRYPFINCTNCGPRFSIIKDIPYDRPLTTMSGFAFCPDCDREYHNPADRRFHAQPVACPVCGPSVWLEVGGVCQSSGDAAVASARTLIQSGGILAVKGLGGFHLACDVGNAESVARLRLRKQRSEKPFALMAFDLAQVEEICIIPPAGRALLQDRSSPVVLLDLRPGKSVDPGVAPGQKTLGVMLAYTPLHLLLLEPAGGFPPLLVMTSGNLSEEPIAYEDDDARLKLSGLADAFLMHNRPIHTRLDDSVVSLASTTPLFLRRSRGFAPDPVRLAEALPPALGAGAELKNTFCLTRDRYAFVSHHIGDLENFETLQAYERSLDHYERLFKIDPQLLACDLHPDYLASRSARQLSASTGLPLVEVQHHHAHLAACLAENGWTSSEPVIGLTFDGTGLGLDGTIWGGEILLGGYANFERLFHLRCLPLPGGDAAVRSPARMALAALWALSLPWEPTLPPVNALSGPELTTLRRQLEQGINTPLTSSMGRLFDIASSLAGIRQHVKYEGQAAMELESLADPAHTSAYFFPLDGGQVDVFPALQALTLDSSSGVHPSVISARFHNGLINLCLACCQQIRSQTDARTAALSGGVWQNRILFNGVFSSLVSHGFSVLTHRQLPPNDGCISLGQVFVAAYQAQI